MKHTLVTHYDFHAAHDLANVFGPKHKCANLHGHTYDLDVYITGDLKGTGIIVDAGTIKALVRRIVIDKLDHTNLNDHVERWTLDPSAEVIAGWIFTELKAALPGTEKVVLWETKSTRVEVTD